MQAIRGDAKSILALLSSAKYAIDYYQREYRWQSKQVLELLDDLGGKFCRPTTSWLPSSATATTTDRFGLTSGPRVQP